MDLQDVAAAIHVNPLVVFPEGSSVRAANALVKPRLARAPRALAQRHARAQRQAWAPGIAYFLSISISMSI